MRHLLLPSALALLVLSACAPTDPQAGKMCGGIAAIECADGYVCMDDATDSCDPNNGGADCGGICIAE